MPSNKIYTVLVLAIGVIVSIWLLQRSSESISSAKQSVSAVSTPKYQNVINTNTDWQKILVSVDPKNQIVTEDLTKNNQGAFDETTMTAQMSKDFFSQYLLLKQGGKALTTADINNITNNILSSPLYTNKGAVYVSGNLHITSKIDIDTVKKYKDTLNLILKTRSSQIKDNPAFIVNSTTNSSGSNELPKLDYITKVGQGLISDLLAVEVPSDALEMHLGLINSVSNLVSDVDGMKQIYTDPVKSLSAVSQYNKDVILFQNSLNAINAYFERKLGKNS